MPKAAACVGVWYPSVGTATPVGVVPQQPRSLGFPLGVMCVWMAVVGMGSVVVVVRRGLPLAWAPLMMWRTDLDLMQR